MAGTRQTFKYRDPRETRLLNQSNKDDLGRQRNHVLYGFSWKASGSNRNQILIGRGAIYTQDGVKIFFDDETSFTVPTIDPGQGLTGGAVGLVDFPYPKNIIVGIQHNFVASATAQDAKLVLIEVRTSQKDQEPAYYIQEIDTITLTPMSQELVDEDRPAYNGLYDSRPGGQLTSANRIAQQKIENSIPNNVTPILKIRIQQLHNGGVVTVPPYLFTSNGQLEDGVEVVRYKNIWQQTNDLLGVNLFEPLIESDQNALGDLNYPSDKRETQDFVTNSAVTLPAVEQHTPTQHPLFGSFDPNVANNYASYRFANFLMDGKSILEGMKRLDAWLRLLVNRTGEQSLVSLVDSLTDLQQIVDQGKLVNGDPINYGTTFMLQNGTVHHVDPGNGGSYGDTHRRALHFLDNSINYIANRLGLTPMMTRAEIEVDNVTTPELWDVSNPPGLDITANMDFHTALQTLRNYFTSRGDDVIVGTHVYSIDDSTRNGVPIGQKTVIDPSKVEITNDTVYIKLENGSIDSSDARSDKIAGNEVATLDSQSRYKIDKIASHDAARVAANQGPKVEGVINAPQGQTLWGALSSVLDYNPQWSQDQLDEWIGATGVISHDGNGGLSLAANSEAAFNPFIALKGIILEWYYDIIGLTMGGGTFKIAIKFYDNLFAHIGGRDIDLLTQLVNLPSGYNSGSISVIGANPGEIPVNAVYFKISVNYFGAGTAEFKLRFGCNVSNERILVNRTNGPGDDPRTLTRKDYVDSLKAVPTGTGLLTNVSTDYPGNPNKEGRIQLPGFGTEYRVPSLTKAGSTPHSPGTIGAALQVLANDGQYWYVPAIPQAQGAACFCQCECECQCQCQCEGNCSCNGQCDCKGGMNCAGGW